MEKPPSSRGSRKPWNTEALILKTETEGRSEGLGIRPGPKLKITTKESVRSTQNPRFPHHGAALTKYCSVDSGDPLAIC